MGHTEQIFEKQKRRKTPYTLYWTTCIKYYSFKVSCCKFLYDIKKTYLIAVIGTAKEPIKGWIDNLYGPTGVVVGKHGLH